MTIDEQREAARQFINKWKGYEKGETQRFWIALLSDVLGVENATDYIEFEKPVVVDGITKFIDGYIPITHVLIEQKKAKDLSKPMRQSDGDMLTPYEQAFRYNNYLNADEKAQWIVTSNFKEIRIYNMNAVGSEPQILRLENLQEEFKYLDFLLKKEIKEVTKEQDLSIQAGEIVGEIYNALRTQYNNPDSEETLKSLNALCVRLVFCMYAEDAGIFGKLDKFCTYMSDIPASKWHRELRTLFNMLNTPEDKRYGYDPDLEEFPYVNGGLFNNDNTEIPAFTDDIVDLIINKGCKGFNWRDISPTIFGAVFESTLNPETRRQGGMHYTSLENIHKVIDPLFLDELKEELAECKNAPVTGGSRKKRMVAFQEKLSQLTFFDPACGSGNFLTETYLSIRRLENEVIRYLRSESEGQMLLDIMSNKDIGVKVSIEQFYGIEINDFAVDVAKTAMWIAEAQMLSETRNSTNISKDFLPLTTNAHIIKENAVTFNWELLLPPKNANYIIGNPPFRGARRMDSIQKKEVEKLFFGWKNVGALDYVSCWYKKAADYMSNNLKIRAALVSTNSITQGDIVAPLWRPLFEKGLQINFAHRTFQWDSETKIKAHVHCVIIGFSMETESAPKYIYEEGERREAQHINAYLVDSPDIFVESRTAPLSAIPELGIGNQPIDGGYYLFSEKDMLAFIEKEPKAKKHFRKWYGAEEFLNNRPRYCLWLEGCPPDELRSMPECIKRVNAVREFRLSSNRASTRKCADTPLSFYITNVPTSNYIVIPEVSSEKRRYIPIGFMTPDVLCSNRVKISENATLYHFGVLTSNVHMAWVRATCGRLETRYCYSVNIVYNNFPWPTPTEAQKKAIEKTAQEILDARKKYPTSTLADLYDENGFSAAPLLKKAHENNDRAVMRAYGFSVGEMSEVTCAAALMGMYREQTKQ